MKNCLAAFLAPRQPEVSAPRHTRGMKKTLFTLLALSGFASAAPKISAQSIIVNPVQADLSVKVWTDKSANTAQVPNYTPGEHIRLYT